MVRSRHGYAVSSLMDTTYWMHNGHVEVTAMPFGVNYAPAVFMKFNGQFDDDRWALKEEKMYVKFSNKRGSGAKRKLSRCGKNQMGNEPILALPEGADDFVVYYDAQSKDLEACLEKKEKRISVNGMESNLYGS
ncbi:hypothetical protein Tco_0942370 [Tanacetum coccineum]